MRFLIAAALAALVAAPAHADRKVCHITRTVDSVRGEVGAVLQPEFDRLLIETGPIYTGIQMRPDSGWRPVREAEKPSVRFYLYWYGDQAPGKPWKEPGGVAFRLGGFGLEWPNFDVPSTQRLRYVRSVVRMGDAVTDRRFEMVTAGFTTYSGQVLPLHKRMWAEWPHEWDHRTFFEEEWAAWIKAFEAGGKMTVEFYDNSDKPFATGAFDLPPLKAFNARAAADIGDFRARVDPADCHGGSRASLP